MAARKKRSRASWGLIWGLLALVPLVAIGLIAFSYLPRDRIPAPARQAHQRVVDARSRIDGTSGEDALSPPAAPEAAPERGKAETVPPPAVETVNICSFNIEFLGSSKERDDDALASVVKGYDLVVVQELVAPPYPAPFPDGTPVKPDPQAAEFFEAMKANGFTYWLSEEDTGTGAKIHSNGTNTEWWVTFYKPDKIERAEDLPHGFLADDRSDNPDYERVPYAFSFRTDDSRMDFVLISVHLQPGSAAKDKARRRHELAAINSWITTRVTKEKDFIILGDCNIENAYELREDTPAGFLSLNDECRPTNTNVNGPKPYDHVFYRPGLHQRDGPGVRHGRGELGEGGEATVEGAVSLPRRPLRPRRVQEVLQRPQPGDIPFPSDTVSPGFTVCFPSQASGPLILASTLTPSARASMTPVSITDVSLSICRTDVVPLICCMACGWRRPAPRNSHTKRTSRTGRSRLSRNAAALASGLWPRPDGPASVSSTTLPMRRRFPGVFRTTRTTALPFCRRSMLEPGGEVMPRPLKNGFSLSTSVCPIFSADTGYSRVAMASPSAAPASGASGLPFAVSDSRYSWSSGDRVEVLVVIVRPSLSPRVTKSPSTLTSLALRVLPSAARVQVRSSASAPRQRASPDTSRPSAVMQIPRVILLFIHRPPSRAPPDGRSQ